MRLGIETNGSSNEFMMQDAFEIWIKEHNEHYKKNYGFWTIKYKREVHVKEVNRIADFLMLSENRLINIELKTNPSQILIDQLRDHKKYCDYCFALVPDFCKMPRWFNEALVKNGFGLYVYNNQYETFTEALPAFYNKPEYKGIRKTQISILSQKTLF